MIETIKDYNEHFPYYKNLELWIGEYLAIIYVDTADNNNEYFYISNNTNIGTDSLFETIDATKGFKTISAIKKYLVKYLRQTRRDIDRNIKQFLLEENNDNNNNKQRNK